MFDLDYPIVSAPMTSHPGGTLAHLKALGYLYVTMDLAGYRTGSLKEAVRRR
jgi:PP-loop superfamily ATP-utilizing enzyme